MTLIFGVVCEAAADQRTACDIADRVICQCVDWVGSDELDSFRLWQRTEAGELYLAWKHLPDLASTLGIKAHGHFEGEPGAPDARAARRAIRVLLKVAPSIDAILLTRDTDGDSRRRTGLEQARKETPFGDKVVLAIAHPKREAWVLAGFEPQDDTERAALQSLRQELGFDPTAESHRIDARQSGAKKDIKRVLKVLCPDAGRESACWRETDLKLLRQNGDKNGLSVYIEEIEARLVPLLGGQEPRADTA